MSSSASSIPNIEFYANARVLVELHIEIPLPVLPPSTHRFPSTRFPDKHTKTIIFALVSLGTWDPQARMKDRINAPCITVSANLDGSFDVSQPLPFREGVPISSTAHKLLYHTSKKLRSLLESNSEGNDIFLRGGGEEGLQGLMFAEEGLMLTLLFAVDKNTNASIFFRSLPPALVNLGWYHGMTSNNLINSKYRDWLSEKATENRAKQKVKANDSLLEMFRKGDLTLGGSIPDHLFGNLMRDAGIVVALVEEKRLHPGALKDLWRMLACHKKLSVFLGSGTQPESKTTREGDVWVGSPEAGHWYARIFLQVYAECNSMDSGYFVITDRFHTVFGCAADNGDIQILHIFSHCLPQDEVKTPLDEYWLTKKKPAGVQSARIRPVGARSEYFKLHSFTPFLEAYIRIIQHAGQNPKRGPGHPHPTCPAHVPPPSKKRKVD
ncbi:uncharacterized protein L201_002012 [Kwoniella dendrophila CBS 6074]|uniref:Uncharacterized protein n=1 Tax=Kwoniella dendrophila CBS 6074 TaxID=1295534 RepID=A0AAX4JQ04_9TREE